MNAEVIEVDAQGFPIVKFDDGGVIKTDCFEGDTLRPGDKVYAFADVDDPQHWLVLPKQ